MTNPLAIDDVRQAKRRLAEHIVSTPLVRSALLNRWLGHEIWFKAECLQRTGAFKVRGAFNMIAWLLENGTRPTRLVANSSGNHAQAVAWSAAHFGIPSTVFMPASVSSVKAQATAAYGAEIELCATRALVDQRTAAAAEAPGVQWVPPFNHPQIVCGQGTAALEALSELGEVDAVFAPCGGGGLLSGTWIAARALAPHAAVIGAEPLQANDAAQSVRLGSIQKFAEAPDTLADGARTLSIGPVTFPYLRQLDDIVEVSEDDIVYWTQWLTHLLKLHVEPTSAMAMAAAHAWLARQSSAQRILVILSGGNLDQAHMAKLWQRDCLDAPPRC